MPISPLAAKANAYLQDHGKITKADAAELTKLAKKSDPNDVRDILEHDAFDSDARAELTKALGKTKAGDGSQFAGARVGTNRYGEEVRVRRELGDTAGYGDKMQAIAVARMGGADPAVVLQGNDGKWHALETTANFYAGGTSADVASRAVVGLPSAKPIAEYEQKISTINKRLGEIHQAIVAGKGKPEDFAAERQGLLEQRGALRKEVAPYLLGVDANDVKFNATSTDRKSDKVNINAQFEKDGGARGKHGAERQSNEDFKLGEKSAFELSSAELDKPSGIEGVLFHEVSHLGDYKLAQQWVKKYQDETGKTFIPNLQGKENPFSTWMRQQAPARLTKAEAEMANSVALGGDAQTEASAYVHSALAALQAGAPDVAADQLATYAGGLISKQNGISGLPAGSEVEKALKKEMEDAYRAMPKDRQADFRAAVAAAKAKNPHAFVSQLKLPQ